MGNPSSSSSNSSNGSSTNSFATHGRHHGSSEELYRHFSKELVGKVLYDRKEVTDRLLGGDFPGISQNPDAVKDILRVIKPSCFDEFKKLKDIASREEKSVKQDETHKPEVSMYAPLMKIFDKIDSACSVRVRQRDYHRWFTCTGSTYLIAHDPIYPDAFKYKPDFSLTELPSTMFPDGIHRAEVPLPSDVFWPQCQSFLEVKATPKDSPVPATHRMRFTAVKHALTQGVNYARSIFSSRPFQLSVYGVILCGGNFWVALFDRRGAVLSPKSSLFRDSGLRTFVRVVLRLTRELPPVALGQDPTVSLLPGHAFHNLKTAYPCFRVGMGGSSSSALQVTTRGRPLWMAHTLLGRGTSVFHIEDSSDRLGMMKTAWRTKNRTGEVDIYHKIHEILGGVNVPGMVKCRGMWGGDVKFPGKEDVVSVSALRHPLSLPPSLIDMILYRVVMYDHGKPLWEFNGPKQLVRALTVALSGHETLCEHGILHRDISAGNILIRMDAKRVGDKTVLCERPVEETEGFLTDFEFASLPGDTAERGESEVGTIQFSAVSDEMTGTAMFISSELLEAVRKGEAISRTALQEVESFAWVVIYVLYKHAVDVAPPRKDGALKRGLKDDFTKLFGGTSAKDVLSRRRTFLADNSANLRKYYESEYAELQGLQGRPNPFPLLLYCLIKSLYEQLPPPELTQPANGELTFARMNVPILTSPPGGGAASIQRALSFQPSVPKRPLTHYGFSVLLRECMGILDSGKDDVS